MVLKKRKKDRYSDKLLRETKITELTNELRTVRDQLINEKKKTRINFEK